MQYEQMPREIVVNQQKSRWLLLFTTAMVILLLTICAYLSRAAESGPAVLHEDADFLIGFWVPRTAVYEGKTMMASEFLQGDFVLHFNSDGICAMRYGDRHAHVAWDMDDKGVTLQGSGTYDFTFADESKTKLTWEYEGALLTLVKQADA